MARKPRIEYEGAFYHVITRGNQRQKTFKDKEDFLKYLEILSRYKSQYKYFLYAFVLMSNHVHLLIETQKTPLSKALQGINQSYTIYFNRKYRTEGHLFQGRYKAILCDRDEYLLSLVKYIHLNPVRATVVKTLDEYLWSSHESYIKSGKGIVDEEQVLRMFSEDKTKARKLYCSFINDDLAVKKEDIYCTIDQRILGNEKFAEKILDKYNEGPGRTRRKKEYTLSEIAGGIEKAYGITLRQIRSKAKDRDISLGRKLISLAAKEYGYAGREVAKYIQKDPAMVTRYLKEKGDLKGEVEKAIKMVRGER
ncbi:MAG: transposase [Nitrospirae bacterium]|nr:transposase [Nitrospirota bacterium]